MRASVVFIMLSVVVVFGVQNVSAGTSLLASGTFKYTASATYLLSKVINVQNCDAIRIDIYTEGVDSGVQCWIDDYNFAPPSPGALVAYLEIAGFAFSYYLQAPPTNIIFACEGFAGYPTVYKVYCQD